MTEEREFINQEHELAHYKQLAALRGELVSCLMSGNHQLGAFLIRQIDTLTKNQAEFKSRSLPAVQEQNLRDALARITNIINQIIE